MIGKLWVESSSGPVASRPDIQKLPAEVNEPYYLLGLGPV